MLNKKYNINSVAQQINVIWKIISVLTQNKCGK